MPEDDILFTSDANYTGNYMWVLDPTIGVRFDFYAEDVLPLASVLYIHSSSGNTWEYAFNNSAVGVWESQDISFLDFTGWTGPGDDLAFWSDLMTVDWIGIRVFRAFDTAAQDYGLDNWQFYTIPEPGTYAMLGTALLSLFAALRARRNSDCAV